MKITLKNIENRFGTLGLQNIKGYKRYSDLKSLSNPTKAQEEATVLAYREFKKNAIAQF